MTDRGIAEIAFEQEKLNGKLNSLGTKIMKVFSKKSTRSELALLDIEERLKELFVKKTLLDLDNDKMNRPFLEVPEPPLAGPSQDV